jgi:hypothetical protein
LWRRIQATIVTGYVLHPSAGALPACALLPFEVFLCEEHERPPYSTSTQAILTLFFYAVHYENHCFVDTNKVIFLLFSYLERIYITYKNLFFNKKRPPMTICYSIEILRHYFTAVLVFSEPILF